MFFPVKWILAQIAKGQAKIVRRRFHDLARRPDRVQRRHLLTQLARERDTSFGRDHHFAEIRTVSDFRRNVPITRYEYYEPYIERVKQGHTQAMFHDQRVLMFAMSSGTTNARKFIPVTQRFLDDYRRGWTIWGLHMFEDHKSLWFKTMLQLASDPDEFRTPAGIPCGSISGLTVQMQRYVIRKTYCLPPESAKIKDVATKYYLAWRLGLVRDVGLWVSANPSTMVNLARFGDEHKDRLVRDIYEGAIDPAFPVPQEVWQAESARLAANPARARELERIVSRTGRLRPKDAWPNLGLIGNWTGGSVSAYMRHYEEYFGNPAVRDVGLIASEGRMTIPIADRTPGGILEITSGFFEFIPIEEIDAQQPTVLESHELIDGRDYYILLTTSSGLYRYNIFDVVRCLGWHEKTPVLAFLNKGTSFSNLTGEKLSEHQVVQAVEAALCELDLRLTAFTLAPCWSDEIPYYGLFVEAADFALPDQPNELAQALERHLRSRNSEYQEKRDSKRLAPVRVCLLPAGTWERWDRERLARTGGTAEQYKHPCLIGDLEFQQQMPVLAAPGFSPSLAASARRDH
jgi:hypothetical protein